MIRAVVFDIGNVLIEWQPERYYDRIIGAERRAAFFAAVDMHGVNELVDRGDPFRDTVMQAAERHPDWAGEIRQWHDNWIELASPVIPHALALLRALRSRGMQWFALSNFGIDSFAFAETQYPFLTEFDRRFISGQMGVTKPDPRIYAMVEEACGLAPETLLFTDDRAENIAAAAARGWCTHLFDGAAGFARRLVAEAILTEAEAA